MRRRWEVQFNVIYARVCWVGVWFSKVTNSPLSFHKILNAILCGDNNLCCHKNVDHNLPVFLSVSKPICGLKTLESSAWDSMVFFFSPSATTTVIHVFYENVVYVLTHCRWYLLRMAIDAKRAPNIDHVCVNIDAYIGHVIFITYCTCTLYVIDIYGWL